jgi:hypothetical protein
MMAKNKALCDKYDLSSVNQIFTGAAPLGAETADELQKQHPTWKVRQGYGTFVPFVEVALFPLGGRPFL